MTEEKDKKYEFYDAWWYLKEHSMFKYDGIGGFQECLDVFVAKVNPENDTVDDDKTKNTKVEIWLETGPYEPWDSDDPATVGSTHDINLDCGAETFEQAIIKLSKLVKKMK